MADGGTAMRSQCKQRMINTPHAGLAPPPAHVRGCILGDGGTYSEEQMAIPWHPTQAKQVQSFPISHTKSRLHSCPV